MQAHGKTSSRQLPTWVEPLSLLGSLPADKNSCWVLLYSGMQTGFTGRYSLLGLLPEKSIKGESFTVLAPFLSSDGHPFLDGWFGYLGYGLKNSLEQLVQDIPSSLFPFPSLWMVQYRLILVFDHEQCHVTAFAQSEADLAHIPAAFERKTLEEFCVTALSSNMTSEEYLAKVEVIKQAIRRGDVYQANLTRKFFGTIEGEISAAVLFQQLCKASPAPYSALLKLEDTYILSSSPEQFLQLDATGLVSSRPIKGSSPRYIDPVEDQVSKEKLQSSEKNKSENLMIVDLMRNDIARSAIPGTVKVESLFDLSSYATIHHLSSTIIGQKKPDLSSLALVEGCFPPGSMTGAPKIKAMELCSQLEQQERGVYSGAIGWFGGDGSLDLSVVIRTMLLRGNYFEFQVGGAIVADSDAEEERQETLTKASALAKVLGVRLEQLEGI